MIDNEYTAVHAGFKTGYMEYYRETSSSNWIDKVKAPTYIVHAFDDPIAAPCTWDLDKVYKNPNIV
jgi:predicted alpha/beta-fold hydrolase